MSKFGRGVPKLEPLDEEIARDAAARAVKAAPVERNTPTAKREDPDTARVRLNLRDADPPSPTRETFKRLPLFTDPFVAREAAKLGVGRKMCDRCVHWKPEAAVAAFKAYPAFQAAAAVLSPQRMSAAKKQEFDEIGQPVGHADEQLTWANFGGCAKVGVITPRNSVCDAFE